jgi:hypothetical protein
MLDATYWTLDSTPSSNIRRSPNFDAQLSLRVVWDLVIEHSLELGCWDLVL